MTDHQAKEFERLILAVGHIVIWWAIVERQLDNWVMITFNRAGGKRLKDYPEIPRSFSKKHRYLKKAFRSLPLLAPFTGRALAMLDLAKQLSAVRHPIVHGSLEAGIAEHGVFRFRHLIHGPQQHSIETVELDLQHCDELQDSFTKFAVSTAELSKELHETFPAKKK